MRSDLPPAQQQVLFNAAQRDGVYFTGARSQTCRLLQKKGMLEIDPTLGTYIHCGNLGVGWRMTEAGWAAFRESTSVKR